MKNKKINPFEIGQQYQNIPPIQSGQQSRGAQMCDTGQIPPNQTCSMNQPIQQICQNGRDIRQDIWFTNQNICIGNQRIEAQVASLSGQLSDLGRKKRRSCTNQFIAVQEQGKILIVSEYDDGVQEAQELMLNVTGEWGIYRLQFSKTVQPDEWFLIHFKSAKCYIFGKMRKLSEAGLYDIFVRAGVVFNSEIRKSKVKDVLYKCFAPLVSRCEAVFQIPELAGWNNGKYLYAEKTGFTGLLDFPQIPILDKHFDEEKLSADLGTDYFRALSQINGIRERLVFLLYPFAGVLASIFAEEDFRIPVLVNFVMLEEVGTELIVAFFQTFNRDILRAWSLSDSEKKLANLLMTLNDEVTVFDAREQQENTKYKNDKIRQNAQMLINRVLGTSGLHVGENSGPYVALALLSDGIICRQQALNIFVTKNLFVDIGQCRTVARGKAISGILAGFVDYAERNLETIRRQIRKRRENMEPAMRFWSVLWEIAEMYWQEWGIDMKGEAKLPNKIDIFSLFARDVFSNEELLEVFAEVIRREICHFTAFDKRHSKTENPHAICFDFDYIYFPSKVFDRILGMGGLLPQKNRILMQLKAADILVVDETGLTRRLQIAGNRREYYQIRRAFFNAPGLPDIVDLVKEDSGYADRFGGE